MKKPVVFIALALGLGLLGAIIYSSMSSSGWRCEVCVSYQGANACRIASAASREGALRAATENACAQITSGMTNSMQCTNSAPVSVKWFSEGK